MTSRHLLSTFTGGLPRPFWVMWWGTVVNRLCGFVVPFLTLFLTARRDLTPVQAAVVVSALGLGSFLSQLIGGALADRVGRRRVMVLALTLSPPFLIVLGLAPTYPLILVAAFVFALISDMYRPASSAAIADLVPPAERTRAYGLMHWAVNLGFAFAPILAGLIAARSYTLLFAVDALTLLLYGVFILLGVPETGRPGGHRGPRPGTLAVLGREPMLLAFSALTLLFALIMRQAYVTLPLAMRADGLGEDTYGAVIALNGLVIAAVGLFSARVLAPLVAPRVLSAALLLAGLGFGLGALADTPAVYALGVVVWTLGEVAQAAVAPGLAAALAPAHLRGLYAGVLGATRGLGALIAPALGGWVLEQYGNGLWWGCLGLGLLGSLGFLLLNGPLQRRVHQGASADSTHA
ncbi:MFS transporter [Deinococcus aetherius]|uniref:MFS transporter n=1 Tax=Deinococcus aetherius TaxID=200252 RepID=UPI00222F479C|nr:MFS transporter [Deinococcus aetherius]